MMPYCAMTAKDLGDPSPIVSLRFMVQKRSLSAFDDKQSCINGGLRTES
jgi:hypothetical protein